MHSRRRSPLSFVVPQRALGAPPFVLAASMLALVACGGGSSAAPPARLALATAPPAGPLDLSKSALAFDAASQTAQLGASEAGYAGPVNASASACDGVVTIAPPSAAVPATFTITAQRAGSCSVTVTDAFGQTASVAVGVTITQGAIR